MTFSCALIVYSLVLPANPGKPHNPESVELSLYFSSFKLRKNEPSKLVLELCNKSNKDLALATDVVFAMISTETKDELAAKQKTSNDQLHLCITASAPFKKLWKLPAGRLDKNEVISIRPSQTYLWKLSIPKEFFSDERIEIQATLYRGEAVVGKSTRARMVAD